MPWPSRPAAGASRQPTRTGGVLKEEDCHGPLCRLRSDGAQVLVGPLKRVDQPMKGPHLPLVPDRIHRMEIVCPYCGETIAVFIDEGGGPMQRYVEDCSVCCRPIELSVDETENGDFSIVAVRGDE